jgi:hypothetical protein
VSELEPPVNPTVSVPPRLGVAAEEDAEAEDDALLVGPLVALDPDPQASSNAPAPIAPATVAADVRKRRLEISLPNMCSLMTLLLYRPEPLLL